MERSDIIHNLRNCLQVMVLASVKLDTTEPITAGRIKVQIDRARFWLDMLEDEDRENREGEKI